jgi:hypothetical protein
MTITSERSFGGSVRPDWRWLGAICAVLLVGSLYPTTGVEPAADWPAEPTAGFATTQPRLVTLLGGETGFGTTVATVADRIFLGAGAQLMQLRLEGDSEFQEAGPSFRFPGMLGDVAAMGDELYVVVPQIGLVVLRTSGEALEQIASLDFPGAREVSVAGGYAYVADAEEGLRIVDCRDPELPREVGRWVSDAEFPSMLHVTVDGNVAYSLTVSEDLLLDIIDVSEPSDPQHLGHLGLQQGTSPSGIAVRAGYVYFVTHELVVIDARDAQQPVQIDGVVVPGCRASNVIVAGDRAFVFARAVSTGAPALVVLSLVESEQPSVVTTVNNMAWRPQALHYAQGRLYAAASDGGL